MKTLLIMNPAAGRRRGSPLEAITAALRQPFVDLTVHLTTCPGEATLRARQATLDGFELVVAAGGDGSVNEVANGLVGTEVALGLVPVGTENVLAREMGVPLDPRRAVEHMLGTPARRIDVGRIGDRRFVCFAGIGFDAHVAHGLTSARKASLGAAAYFLTSFERILGYRKIARHATLVVDGEMFESTFWMMLVGNIQNYGGGLKPSPRARLDDGLLDLCVFPMTGVSATLKQMLHTTKGRHLELPGMISLQARRIEIVTDPIEQVQLDGDPFAGTTPLVVEVEPRSLSVRF